MENINTFEDFILNLYDEDQQKLCKNFKKFTYLKFIPIFQEFKTLTITDSLVFSYYWYWASNNHNMLYTKTAIQTAKELGLRDYRYLYKINKKLFDVGLISDKGRRFIQVDTGFDYNDEDAPYLKIPNSDYIKIPSVLLPFPTTDTNWKLFIGELYSHSLNSVYRKSIKDCAKCCYTHRKTISRYFKELEQQNLIELTKRGVVKILLPSQVIHHLKWRKKPWLKN